MLKRISTLLSSTLLLQACTSGVPGVIEQPKISIENISLQDISLTQGTALVTLNVANPNAFPIPLQGIQYHPFVILMAQDDTSIAKGDFYISNTLI